MRRIGMLLVGLSVLITSLAAGSTAIARSKIVVFGDVHGGATELRSLLEALEMIDQSGSWVGGDTRLVSLGDLLDRGPDSKAVMDLLMRIASEAPQSGGQFHMVLGNHEIMNLTGDMRYVAQEEFAAFAGQEDPADRQAARDAYLTASADPETAAAEFEQHHPPGFFGHRRAFQPTGRYGRWLLAHPQILVLDGTVFVHGGLSDRFGELSIQAFNDQATAELRELLELGENLIAEGRLPPWQDLLHSQPTDPEAGLPARFLDLRASLSHQIDGPSWYRGTAGCHPLIEQPRFERVLAAQSVQRIVMGHTPTNPRIIQTRFDGRAVLADTGMYAEYYRGSRSALIIDGDQLTSLTLNARGELVPLQGRPAIDLRVGDEQALHDELEAALTDAGRIRRDRPVSLTAQGRTWEVTALSGRNRDLNDHLAAQTLDKLLGLGLVAPVLRHEHDGKKLVIEALPDGSVSETTRVTGNLHRPNLCEGTSDYQLMYVLDTLLGNQSRNGESIRYDRATWLMYLSGHGDVFPTSERAPAYLEGVQLRLPIALRDRLAALSNEKLSEALGEYLGDRQLKALSARKATLLASWPVEE
jgi:hypothetical protein